MSKPRPLTCNDNLNEVSLLQLVMVGETVQQLLWGRQMPEQQNLLTCTHHATVWSLNTQMVTGVIEIQAKFKAFYETEWERTCKKTNTDESVTVGLCYIQTKLWNKSTTFVKKGFEDAANPLMQVPYWSWVTKVPFTFETIFLGTLSA